MVPLLIIAALFFAYVLDKLGWNSSCPDRPEILIARSLLGAGAFVTAIWIGLLVADPDVVAEQSVERYPWIWAVTAATLGLFALLYIVNLARKLASRNAQPGNQTSGPPSVYHSVGGLVIVTALLAAGNACYSRGIRLHATSIEFAPVLMRLPVLARQTQPTGRLNRRGKLLIVFRYDGAAPYIVSDGTLVGYLQPGSLREVGMVLLVTEDKKVVRSYTPGGTDYQWILNAQLFNWPQGKLAAAAVFSGTRPPDRSGRPGGTDIYGDKPVPEIERWLDQQTGNNKHGGPQ